MQLWLIIPQHRVKIIGHVYGVAEYNLQHLGIRLLHLRFQLLTNYLSSAYSVCLKFRQCHWYFTDNQVSLKSSLVS